MIKLLTTTAIGWLVIAPAVAAEHSQAEAEKAVNAFAANYIKLWNAKDVAGVAALFADNGLEVPPLKMVAGKDDIEKTFKMVFDSGASDLRYDIKRVQAEGDIVYAVGEFQVKLPKGDLRGNFVNIYEWQGDGLKYRVHSYNFIPPSN